ncbi:MAG: xseA, partial [Betaproteobacteria bacterium]|nr:xseA [Betaproteobacteria bacterium]
MLSQPDFDDAAKPPVSPGERSRAISVSELNRGVRGMLERGYPLVAVRGEISNFTRAASGHIYFVLKDAGAQVRCAMWRGKAQALSFVPANGDAVEVRANVTLFEARGEFQLAVESMRRDGAGNLFEAFLRLKEKLAGEGLFDPERKRPLPALPRAIGVVTSPQAAALRDIVTALKRRAPMIPVVIYPTPVQGEGAAARIAQAIATANARAEVEVLLVCRGGGSIEDLWSFNEEVVARAIAASDIPVISGVGHETDFTIADFAADLRAPTPTAAAELAAPHRDDLLARLSGAAYEMRRAMQAYLDEARQKLDWTARDLVPPSARLAAQRRDLGDLARRLDWLMQRGRERRGAALH